MKVKQFELTGKCNSGCEFCYNKDNLKGWGELNERYVLEKAGGDNLIFLGGGEPALYSGIENLVEDLLKGNNTVVLSTNGISYREFPKDKRLQIQVSLPALDRDAYRRITGRDSVDEVKRNILRYGENHKAFVNFPAYEGNIGELDKVAEFCEENGVPLVVSPIMPAEGIKDLPEGKLKGKCLELALSKDIELQFTSDRDNKELELYSPGLEHRRGEESKC